LFRVATDRKPRPGLKLEFASTFPDVISWSRRTENPDRD